VKSSITAVFVQFLSAILVIIGIIKMRKAYAAAGIHLGGSDVIPWETALVVVFVLLVTLIDLRAMWTVIRVNETRQGCGCLLVMLHIALAFIGVFVAVSSIALAVGYCVQGLAESSVLANFEDESDALMYGLHARDIVDLGKFVNTYNDGAWMVVFGAIVSIPAQGWLIFAVSVERSFQNSRDVVYRPDSKRQDSVLAYYSTRGKRVQIAFPAESSSDPHEPLIPNIDYTY